MKVRELIEILSKVNQDLPVWTSGEYELPLTRDALVIESVTDDDGNKFKALTIAA